MQRNIAVGIDIGTSQVRVVVVEVLEQNDKLVHFIIGTGSADSKGLRHGYITNVAEAAKSIKIAAKLAEKAAGVKIDKAYVSVGGVSLLGNVFQGAVSISRTDSEITEQDLVKVNEASKSEMPQSFALNRRVLHTIPLQYKVDGRVALGRPNGMKGARLEVRTLYITCLTHHLNDLISAVEEAGIDVEDVAAAPLAASHVVLTKSQKIAGVVLANIGSETVSIIVFENNIPVSVEVFPIGSNDITNDIALGMKVPLDEAEGLKTGVGAKTLTTPGPKKKLDEIVRARLSDIFELIDAHLAKIGRNGLLPAGVVITGGGSGLMTIEDLAKANLRLPSKRSDSRFETNVKGQIKNSEWSVAYGLCVMELSPDDESDGTKGLRDSFKNTRKNVWNWIKQFLP
jgi:cell division protein FtsA